ncbi:NTP transferase domain-containing protein [Paracoccus ravus]|uniref:NTP transferase domain-containing protein n=1 Tax=Paracoccus ravus TaxID=2447760 RepID=UPI001430C00E|nr:NTP transferase domain-containing protein [Paracoccus ravus]
MSLGVLILAAGGSRRFGPSDKLMARIAGRPMLAHVLTAFALPEARERLVVVSSRTVADLVHRMGFEPHRIAPGQEQSASLRAGVDLLGKRGAERILVGLGDMPWITRDDLRALLALATAEAACASRAGIPMPPAVFPARLFDDLTAATGDRGAGAVLRHIPPSRQVHLPDAHLRDVDEATDLA